LGSVQNSVYQTDVFAKYGDEADAEIARIIEQNAAGGPARAAQVSRPATAPRA
ncbi:EmrA/EmrK family multidrug efflux transporter periplasmic adaptor subunit, partial [Burkholderia gladioli]